MNLLSTEEMEELYCQYQFQINIELAKKIMLGLLIYQGITTDEIIRLELYYIRLKKAGC